MKKIELDSIVDSFENLARPDWQEQDPEYDYISCRYDLDFLQMRLEMMHINEGSVSTITNLIRKTVNN